MVEKYDQVATVNSHGRNNSQTIHCGDIETNYTLSKAVTVKSAAEMLVNYARKQNDVDQIVKSYPKMVLGVGKRECDLLRERYEIFREHFPAMELWEKDKIAEIEPNVVKGRAEEIVAIGIMGEETAVEYQALSKSFVKNALEQTDKKIDLKMGVEVEDIRHEDDVFVVKTQDGQEISAKFVVVSAGGHSLLLAQRMGYGKNFSCLPMAGSFYFAPEKLNGKVYTVQNDKLPFAAIHGDPDVLVPGKTRFGPTALMLPMLERYNASTFWDFLKVLRLDRSVVKVFWDLFKVKDIRNYIFKNMLFEVPFLRRRLFLKEARKIIPDMKLSDLSFAKGFGGVRPQLIDKDKKKLMMGEAKINPGNGIVFNMTPSPGGTSCLANALVDLKLICEHLGLDFDQHKFDQELVSS